MSKNPKYHERTQQLEVKMHCIRDENGIVDVVKVFTEDNLVGILTKPVPTIKFKNSLNLIRINNL